MAVCAILVRFDSHRWLSLAIAAGLKQAVHFWQSCQTELGHEKLQFDTTQIGTVFEIFAIVARRTIELLGVVNFQEVHEMLRMNKFLRHSMRSSNDRDCE
jgi:hypothetical protein